MIIVGLQKPEGGIVGITYSAGNLQIEACSITFITANSKQVLEIAHIAHNVILIQSFVRIDGESSVNLKTFNFQLQEAEIHCQDITYKNTDFVLNGSIIA